MAAKNEVKAEATKEPLFTKEQVLGSRLFVKEKDILSALLNEEKEYTMDEVIKKVEKFKKRTVR